MLSLTGIGTRSNSLFSSSFSSWWEKLNRNDVIFKLMIQILVIVQSACPGSNWITNLVAYIARANHGFYSILKSNWRHSYPPPSSPPPSSSPPLSPPSSPPPLPPFLTPPLPPPSSFWMGCLSIIRKSQRISSGLIKRSPVKQKYTVYPFILLGRERHGESSFQWQAPISNPDLFPRPPPVRTPNSHLHDASFWFHLSVYLSNSDVLELRRQRKHSEQLNLTQSGLQQAVVCSNSFLGAVIMAGNTT